VEWKKINKILHTKLSLHHIIALLLYRWIYLYIFTSLLWTIKCLYIYMRLYYIFNSSMFILSVILMVSILKINLFSWYYNHRRRIFSYYVLLKKSVTIILLKRLTHLIAYVIVVMATIAWMDMQVWRRNIRSARIHMSILISMENDICYLFLKDYYI
jgi:hypothetical protein